jgi:succinate dehydrogenase/fumarate reductase flavoprotein subunit
MEKEDISHLHCLFRRIHRAQIDSKLAEPKPKPIAFTDEELSVDWCKYSSAEESRQRIKSIPHPKNPAIIRDPDDYSVSSLAVAKIRDEIQNLKVEHDPDETTNNLSHSLVLGNKTETQEGIEIRMKLRDMSRWIIYRGK